MKQIVIGVYTASGVLSDMEKDIWSMLYVTCKEKKDSFDWGFSVECVVLYNSHLMTGSKTLLSSASLQSSLILTTVFLITPHTHLSSLPLFLSLSPRVCAIWALTST